MLFTDLGRSVLGKTVSEVSSTARGRKRGKIIKKVCTHFTSDHNFCGVLVVECFYHRFATVASVIEDCNIASSEFQKT